MTYTPKSGYFPVGIINSDNIVSGTGNIAISNVYTSEGYYGTSAYSNGLTISETQSENHLGIGPYLSTGPSSTGGLGTDMGHNLGGRGNAGTLAGALYSNNLMTIYYETYDTDKIVSNGYILSFGGFS